MDVLRHVSILTNNPWLYRYYHVRRFVMGYHKDIMNFVFIFVFSLTRFSQWYLSLLHIPFRLFALVPHKTLQCIPDSIVTILHVICFVLCELFLLIPIFFAPFMLMVGMLVAIIFAYVYKINSYRSFLSGRVPGTK